MDQDCRHESVLSGFAAHSPGSEAAQLGVHCGEQGVPGARIAGFNGRQQLGYAGRFAYAAESPKKRESPEPMASVSALCIIADR